MFCPECGAEYREGFTECSDCRIPLVPTLPEPTEDERALPDIELVTVFDSANPALIGIAKTVLESAGIEFVTVGENSARIMFGANPFVGRVRIQVAQDRAEEAEALLAEIEEHEGMLGEE